MDFPRTQACDFELNASIIMSQNKVDAALRDNVDTPAAMAALSDLIRTVNKYLEKKKQVVGGSLRFGVLID